ncbi:hypothetical protein MRX96_039209 [Rhipicephalus microplus]
MFRGGWSVREAAHTTHSQNYQEVGGKKIRITTRSSRAGITDNSPPSDWPPAPIRWIRLLAGAVFQSPPFYANVILAAVQWRRGFVPLSHGRPALHACAAAQFPLGVRFFLLYFIARNAHGGGMSKEEEEAVVPLFSSLSSRGASRRLCAK